MTWPRWLVISAGPVRAGGRVRRWSVHAGRCAPARRQGQRCRPYRVGGRAAQPGRASGPAGEDPVHSWLAWNSPALNAVPLTGTRRSRVSAERQRFALPAVRSRASLSAAPPWQLGVRHLHARRDDWYYRGYPACRSELVGICGRRGEPGHLQPGVVWSGLQWRGRARGRLPHGDRQAIFPEAARTSPGAARCHSAGRSVSGTRSGPGAAGGLSPVATARRSRRSSRACSSME